MATQTPTYEPADKQVPGYFLLKVEVKEPVDDDPRNSKLVRTHYVFAEIAASVNFTADGLSEDQPLLSMEAMQNLLESQKRMTTGVAEIVESTVLIGPGNAEAGWTVVALGQSKQSFPTQSFPGRGP